MSETQFYKGELIALDSNGNPYVIRCELDGENKALLKTKDLDLNTKIDSITNGTTPITAKLSNRDTKRFKIADAVQIRDIIEYFDLITHAELTAEEIREYNEISIAIRDGHNQVGNVGIYLGFSAANGNDFINPFNGSKIYYKEALLSADIYYLHFVSENVGEGGSAIPIPALKCVKDNLIIMLVYDVAPTSGDVTIVVEMRK